ncbi:MULTISPECIES: DcaP family trimeric outer membrane transporter [Anaeromyxobacter]|uniref:DcaP family trimeric outer membrane transporter n=1 Tax=Anaeromyxobacter TaxID=161492 RepID=UPI001F579BBE|nr:MULTISPECIES: DcaP family trimeric outer membrane transporter [unclassified Anaeromyxobacter]
MSTRNTIFGISLLTLLLGGAARAEEAARPDDVQALRAEVKRLAEELEALKARAAAPTPASYTPPPAPAAEQVAALAERVDVVEIQQKDAVVAGDVPGSFRVPGTELSLRLYGFAELNWVHAFGPDNSDIDYATFAPYLPLEGTAAGRRTNRDYLTARTSRLGIDAATPTRYGVLGVKIEGDFNNEPRTGNTAQYGAPENLFTQQQTSSYGFRVRHLYGVFGGLLVGQTWSTFMDVDNYPETVDYNGPTGATFIRQPVIRYTYATQSAGGFTVALENSSSYVLDSRAGPADSPNPDYGLPIPTSLSRVPDVVVRWDKGFQWGALGARAMTQELRFDDGDGTKAAARGWGAAASASFKVRGSDWLALQVTGGDGIGRYLNYIEGALYDAAAGRIRTERAVGVIAGYQLKPAGWVRVNFVYGATRDLDGSYTDVAKATGLDGGRYGVNRSVQQLHVGPIFTPVKGVDVGVEGIWAQRRTLAGERGEDQRLDFSVKYYVN